MNLRPRIPIVLVEDNDTFRATLELLFGLRADFDQPAPTIRCGAVA